jgi:hypothetical protein
VDSADDTLSLPKHHSLVPVVRNHHGPSIEAPTTSVYHSLVTGMTHAIPPSSAPRVSSAQILQACAKHPVALERYLLPVPDAMQAKHAYLLLLYNTFMFTEHQKVMGAVRLLDLLNMPIMQRFLETKCQNGPITASNGAAYRLVTNAIWSDYLMLAKCFREQGIEVLAPANADDDSD